MDRGSKEDLSHLDVEEWAKRIARVWTPSRLREIRPRAQGGFLFIAELSDGLTLHLGIQQHGMDVCALWDEDDYILWDYRLGFCWIFGQVPLAACDGPTDSEHPLCLLIRRNCYLLGAHVEATTEEMREWDLWLAQR